MYPYIHVYIELNVHNVDKNKSKKNTKIRLAILVNMRYGSNITNKRHEYGNRFSSPGVSQALKVQMRASERLFYDNFFGVLFYCCDNPLIGLIIFYFRENSLFFHSRPDL